MAGLSLLRCAGCGFTTGDVIYNLCGPCERRHDHARRLAEADEWYLEAICAFSGDRYASFDEACEVFCAVRAIGGWAAVGVEEAPRREPAVITTRPCRKCGETTSSASGYFCAGCHFAGWWGKWADRVDEREPVLALAER
jgi:hypothetical protein